VIKTKNELEMQVKELLFDHKDTDTYRRELELKEQELVGIQDQIRLEKQKSDDLKLALDDIRSASGVLVSDLDLMRLSNETQSKDVRRFEAELVNTRSELKEEREKVRALEEDTRILASQVKLEMSSAASEHSRLVNTVDTELQRAEEHANKTVFESQRRAQDAEVRAEQARMQCRNYEIENEKLQRSLHYEQMRYHQVLQEVSESKVGLEQRLRAMESKVK